LDDGELTDFGGCARIGAWGWVVFVTLVSGYRETVEHPFGTIKMRMGATHCLTKTLPKVVTEMALHVLAYNLTRVLSIFGAQPIMAAIRA
jgi:Transposase DDE domain